MDSFAGNECMYLGLCQAFEKLYRSCQISSTNLFPFQITDAIKKFGLDPTSSSLVLVKICDLETDINRQASDALHDLALKLVDGQLMPLGDIQTTTTNWKEVRKVYKLNEDRAIKQLDIKVMQGTAHAQELHELIDQLVISTVALKTVAG